MSRIAEYAKKEQLLKQLQEELLKLEQDDELKNELEFKDQLEMLMTEYGKSSKEVIQIIAPERFFSENNQKKTTRKPRKLKVYKNPHTGEVVETRGGNHKQIRSWKDEHGNDAVESWLVSEDGDNVDINKAVEETSTPSTNTEQEEGKQEEETKQEQPTKEEKAPESSNKDKKDKKDKEEEAKQ